jgi:hypothetical protein
MALCASAISHEGRQYEEEDALFAGRSFSICEAAYEYAPRRFEESVLYRVVAENIESFLTLQQASGRVVPMFVEREMRAFLDCGVLARGFLRVHCDACRMDRVVPFSCKSRAFRPSCRGRMRILCAVNPPDAIQKIPACLGLPTRAPPISPAALHLPQAIGIASGFQPAVILMVLLMNGLAGLIFGWLYWRYGLLSAMVAHFSTDIVLHMIGALMPT